MKTQKSNTSKPFANHQPIFELLEPREMFSVGSLDPSFNSDGKATLNFGSVNASSRGVAVQSDGKTIIVGGSSDGRFAIARFNFDGSPDTTFGPTHTGEVLTSFGQNKTATAAAVKVDGSGRIVVAGEVVNTGGPYPSIALARYTSSGLLDTTFGTGGRETTKGNNAFAQADDLAFTNTGQILVGGTGEDTSVFSANEPDMMVARFNGNGSLDESFGDDGSRRIAIGDFANGRSIAVDYSGTAATNPYFGTIVIVGQQGLSPESDIAVSRLTANGSIDGRFAGGRESFPVPGHRFNAAKGVTIQSGGKIVIAATIAASTVGTSPGDIGLLRLLPTGALDQTFGNGVGKLAGFTVLNVGGNERAGDILQTPDGKLIVGGSTDNKFLIAKFTANGIGDGLFGVTHPGNTVTDFGDNSAGIGRLAYGPGNRIVATGGSQFHTARYLDTGGRQVFAATLNSMVNEGASGGFLIYRDERLPIATRVFLSITGAATGPSVSSVKFKTADYTVGGMTVTGLLGTSGYVDIPANQTFAVVNFKALADSRLESDEAATFTITPDAAYDITSPSAVTMTVHDENGLTVKALADAYVRDGNSANTNFGTAADLEVKTNATTGLNRNSYLTFDISQLDAAKLGTVSLQLFGELNNSSQQNIATSVFGLPNTTFSETGITFNTQPEPTLRVIKPVAPTPLATTIIRNTTAQLYTWDITAFVKAQLALGAKTITLELNNQGSSDPLVQFNSREAASNTPALVASYL